MKKLLYLLPLLWTLSYGTEATPISIEQFTGGTDAAAPDKLGLTYAPFDGMQNVRTDERAQIQKRLGSVKFNTIPTTGQLRQRNLYTFNQNNGNSYLITVSSASVWGSLNGVETLIISSRAMTGARDRFVTINNQLWGMNGVNSPFSWDGSTTTTIYTIANSTGFPTGKYCAYWLQRLWIAGDPANPSRIYWSDPGQPASFSNALDIATNDGDQITGIMLDGQGNFLVTKNYATYRIYQYETGGFTYLQVSPVIGCLYDTTMCIFNNLPTWLSNRGIEQLNGSTFNEPPISAPIDNYFKSLSQISGSTQKLLTLPTTSTWVAGSGTNIDTTTYSGSVAVASSIAYSTQTYYNVDFEVQRSTTVGFIPAYDIWASSAIITRTIKAVNSGSGGFTDNLTFSLLTSTMGIIATQTFPGGGSGTFTRHTQIVLNLNNILLSKNATYYWYVYCDHNFGVRNSVDDIAYFAGSINSPASYITQSLNAGSSWGSWGTFQPNDSQPTGSLINYYAVTSTSSYNLNTNIAFPVSNGNTISSLVGPYIQIISSFSRTDATVNPLLNSINIVYYGINDDIPFMTVYNRKLFLQVKSPSATSGNDTVIICQKDGTWTKDALNASGWTVFRNNLYFGSSTDNGFIYRGEVLGVYTDDGNNYVWYYTTKPIWVHPYQRVTFKDIWVQTDNTGSTLDLGYRMDESAGAFQTGSYKMDSRLSRKLPISPPLAARAVQIRVGDFNGVYSGAANINRLYLSYDSTLSIE
jgi:hypothetical protein